MSPGSIYTSRMHHTSNPHSRPFPLRNEAEKRSPCVQIRETQDDEMSNGLGSNAWRSTHVCQYVPSEASN